MRIARAVALLCVLAMGGALIYGFAMGDFSGEGSILVGMPWGVVSLVDVYTGITLFSAWVVYRERSFLRSVVWIALMIVLGFFTAALYTFVALQQSEGDWRQFFLGNRRAVVQL